MANLATSPTPVMPPDYGVSHPRVPASQTTFTQTYATTATTVATATVGSVATTASTTLANGFTAAQADSIPVAINALTADVLVLRKLVNALIDALQASGISL